MKEEKYSRINFEQIIEVPIIVVLNDLSKLI